MKLETLIAFHPKKKNPSATVEGKAIKIPAIVLFTFSAAKESNAIILPPTINDTIS